MNGHPELQFDVAYPDHLSRLLIFVKWLLALPHLIVLSLLWVAFAVTTVIAWVAILITARYPRGLFAFATMVLRGTARTIVYEGLLRDEYPPFTDAAPYPVVFALAYPERLSRWKIFLKGILVIPHVIVSYVLDLVAGLIGVITWWAIVVTGRYPRGLFDFMVGYLRWSFRVGVYTLLLTDAYPPFMLGPTGGQPAPAYPDAARPARV